jgi:hypothetical protein
MTKQITIELPDNADLDAVQFRISATTMYHVSRIAPVDRPEYVPWWTVSRHDDKGCFSFPIDTSVRTLPLAMEAIARDIEAGREINALITWVCELVEAGCDRSNDRAARRYESQVAENCQ